MDNNNNRNDNTLLRLLFRLSLVCDVRRRRVLISSIFALLVLYYLLHKLFQMENQSNRRRPKIFLFSHLPESRDRTCRLPLEVDPWDPSVKEFLNSDGIRRIVCPKENSSIEWTEMDSKGIVRQKSSSGLRCRFWVYRRTRGEDNSIDWLENGVIDPKTGIDLKAINEKSIENRFLYVKCVDKKTGEKYENNHFFFDPKPIQSTTRRKKRRRRASVLVLVIESMSRINFLRHMRTTKQTFEGLGHVFYMRGLTKMADNSHPNMIPFLTGKTVDQFGGRYDKGPFDDYPFVWKRFKEEGFQTCLMEDKYDITLFNELEIGRQGFRRPEQPLHFYPLPFWRQLVSSDRPLLEDYCYWDRRPRLDVFLEQLRHFIGQSRAHSYPYFAFAFYIQVSVVVLKQHRTHVRFNNAEKIDGHYARFLAQMKDIIENDFVILMGDHGSRFGDGFLQTTIGRIEERMPLMAIHVPNAVLKTFPHLGRYLSANRDRLVTWLDLHRMLVDIVEDEFWPLEDTGGQTSYSLWRQTVPENRSCSEALIPQMYCVCDVRSRLSVDDVIAVRMSYLLIQRLNGLLPKVCHQLSIRQIISAHEISPSTSVRSDRAPNRTRLFELTLELSPSAAVIRTQIGLLANGETVELDEEEERALDWLTRLNSYGKQSFCLDSSVWRKICFCFNQNSSQVLN